MKTNFKTAQSAKDSNAVHSKLETSDVVLNLADNLSPVEARNGKWTRKDILSHLKSKFGVKPNEVYVRTVDDIVVLMNRKLEPLAFTSTSLKPLFDGFQRVLDGAIADEDFGKVPLFYNPSFGIVSAHSLSVSGVSEDDLSKEQFYDDFAEIWDYFKRLYPYYGVVSIPYDGYKEVVEDAIACIC